MKKDNILTDKTVHSGKKEKKKVHKTEITTLRLVYNEYLEGEERISYHVSGGHVLSSLLGFLGRL